MIRKVISALHTGLSWAVVATVVMQFFLAGVGVFQAGSAESEVRK